MLYWLMCEQEAFWNPCIGLNSKEPRVKRTIETTFSRKKITFQLSISKVIYELDNSLQLIINFDQTLLSHISPGKYTFNIKVAKNTPVKGINEKRQIKATFAVSAVRDFLPIQLIYTGNTKTCLPIFTFSNDWKSILKKSFFHSLRKAETSIV